MNKKIDILKDSTSSVFLKYLIPSICATLVTSIYILADTIMIGKGVGAVGIAALNIVLPVFNLYFGTGLMFGVGGSVLMSMRFGQGKIEGGRNYFTTALWGNMLAILAYYLLFGLFLDPILYLLGATGQTFALAKGYAVYLVIGTPVFMMSSLLQVFVRNDKAPNTSMIAVISGGVSNVILDYLFIFVMGMGMKGGAVATVMGSAITVTILCSHFFTSKNNLKLTKNGFTKKRLGAVVKNGFASGLVEVSSGIVVLMFNIQLVKYVGDIGITAYGIISNSSLIVMSLANGVAQAGQPIISTNFGAGKNDRIKEIRTLGLFTTGFIGTAIFILGVLFPQVIVEIFVTPTTEILALAIPAIRIYFFSFIAMNFNIFYSTYFQATGKAGLSLGIGMMRGLILSVVLVLILPILFGVTGIWIVMPLVEMITLGVICIVRRK